MASKAIYQHHERTTLAAVVADLQEREIGLDGATGYVVGYNATLAAAFYIPSSAAALTVSTIPKVNASGRLANSGITDNGTTITHTLAVVCNLTLGVTGVATFTVAPVMTALTASLPVFTNGSKALVSNAMTGTGNVVMSSSPTLTGTIVASYADFAQTITALAVNVNGANAQAYFKVNVLGGGIAISGGDGVGAIGAYSNDVPGATNNEYILLGKVASGSAYFQIGKNGSGTSRSFEIRTGDAATAQLTISAAGVSTFAGLVVTVLSATGSAGFRLPHGAAPTSPVNGDLWTTTAGMFVQINGVSKTVTLL